ncbi:hypothetical protein [Echinicola salinicaeni]|uniref:hypothetical protein n=1 Tax=Echinicola salinicaeni TaxID=2762757 RepID=UPI001C98D6EA|nr:hypothetical protein [Echinicola salinicaeni]
MNNLISMRISIINGKRKPNIMVNKKKKEKHKRPSMKDKKYGLLITSKFEALRD